MPVAPNLLERLLLLRFNRGPAPMLDLFGAAAFESVTLALDLGIFERLDDADGPLSAAALAEQVDAHLDGVAALCDFLVAERYLATADGGYELTAMTETWLLDRSETNMGPWLTFWNDLVFPFWEEELRTAIVESEPSQSIYEWFDEEPSRWDTAQAGFRATASLVIDDVVDAVTVPDSATRLLDIGGGHGLYAFELCRRHPDLLATVFDVPGAIETLRDEIPPALADRVDTVAGDYRTDDFGGRYDVALLFNVIHAHDPAENVVLFSRVAESLGSGGRIAVLDQWEGSGRTPVGRAGLRFVRLTYLTTLGATVYSYDDVEAWLKEAGFTDVRRERVGSVAGMAVVEATKE